MVNGAPPNPYSYFKGFVMFFFLFVSEITCLFILQLFLSPHPIAPTFNQAVSGTRQKHLNKRTANGHYICPATILSLLFLSFFSVLFDFSHFSKNLSTLSVQTVRAKDFEKDFVILSSFFLSLCLSWSTFIGHRD